MRIAVFVSLFPKLSETFILNQIVGLIEAGHEVDIFPHDQGVDLAVQEDVYRHNLLDRTFYSPKIPQNWLWRFLKAVWLSATHFHRNPAALLRSLNIFKYGHWAASLLLFYQTIAVVRGRGHYDIIHCHFGERGNTVLVFKSLGAITGPILVSFHGADANIGSIPERTEKYKELFASDAWFTANTQYTKNKLVEIGCHAERVFQIYESLRVYLYPYHVRAFPRDNVVNILSVCRLTEKKGLKYSIQAFRKLTDRGFDAYYHIVGDGYQKQELLSMTSDLGLEDRVRFHGSLATPDILKIAEECHFFVLASVQAENGDSEGQGLVLQEAQAMGLPVISTRHNGIPEGVNEGQTAFLVPERDIDALAERMIFMVEHPEIWRDMGYEGRKFVEDKFDTTVLKQELIDIYHYIAENN